MLVNTWCRILFQDLLWIIKSMTHIENCRHRKTSSFSIQRMFSQPLPNDFYVLFTHVVNHEGSLHFNLIDPVFGHGNSSHNFKSTIIFF